MRILASRETHRLYLDQDWMWTLQRRLFLRRMSGPSVGECISEQHWTVPWNKTWRKGLSDNNHGRRSRSYHSCSIMPSRKRDSWLSSGASDWAPLNPITGWVIRRTLVTRAFIEFATTSYATNDLCGERTATHTLERVRVARLFPGWKIRGGDRPERIHGPTKRRGTRSTWNDREFERSKVSFFIIVAQVSRLSRINRLVYEVVKIVSEIKMEIFFPNIWFQCWIFIIVIIV